MSDVEMEDAARLSAESEQFRAHLDRLALLEDEKRELPPTDPRFLDLAQEIEGLAAGLLNDAYGQTELGKEARRDGVAMAIVDVPDTLTAIQVLAQWREAERRLAEESPSSDEAHELRSAIDAYRRAYQRVFRRTREG